MGAQANLSLYIPGPPFKVWYKVETQEMLGN